MLRIVCQGLLLLITNVSGETIQSDDIPAFETSVMWQIVYEPWHVKAVESHQHFFSKTHVNEGESYTDFVPNMTLPSKINWVSSLEVLPDSFNGHGRTTDLMDECDPTERRKGLGTILMINALERIRQRNIRWVVLQAQPLGEGLYRTLGFIPIGYIAKY